MVGTYEDSPENGNILVEQRRYRMEENRSSVGMPRMENPDKKRKGGYSCFSLQCVLQDFNEYML